MSFAYPHQLLWLLPWAALTLLMVLRERGKVGLLRQFARLPMLRQLASEYSPGRAFLSLSLLSLSLLCLVISLARPQWGVRLEKVEREGLDIVFAVDVSRSMNARDYAPDRLSVATRELSELVKGLEGNRMGLVGFAGTALTFCPLTLDEGATRMFLEQMTQNVIPIQGTALGEAIRESLKLYRGGESSSRVLILLTDGEDHDSDPLGAAQEAAKEGVAIYTLGIGEPEGVTLPEYDLNGNEAGTVLDEAGRPVTSKLDEETLRQIADLTGGSYLHVDEGGQATQTLLRELNQLEKKRLESRLAQRRIDRYQIFAGLGLALLFASRLLRRKR
ncbi:MAG: VWA domain-containing protein [Candidatus Eremiobacterota bacterium]